VRSLAAGVALALLATACGGEEPPITTADSAVQVPPADAGPVEIADVVLEAGSDGSKLLVDGTQPTPCHGLGWFVATEAERIVVTVWSEPPPPDVACAQVIAPFSIEIDLDPAEAGTEVVLNGEVVGTVG